MLTINQLKDIKDLQTICEHVDGIQLKLNWDMLQNREENVKSDIFYYENGKLVGFLALYGFGSKVELCGMVHPDYRRLGIFTNLFTQANELFNARKYEEILLNAPSKSSSAKKFLQSIKSSFAFSEHQMKWEETKLSFIDDVTLRSATSDDLEIEIQLDVICFGFTEEDARDFNQRIRREELQQFYIIEFNGCNVGKVRISHTDGEAWIYGFAIFPEYQGKGIGRKTLMKIIGKEQKEGFPIFLEVEAKNAHALKLYESCGFKAYQSQDYYTFNTINR